MKEINREAFEFWLWSQSEEREFYYGDTSGGCAVCRFIAETTPHGDVTGGGSFVYLGGYSKALSLPDWLRCGSNGVLGVSPLTIGNMRRRYLELFPETFIASESHQPEGRVKG